MNILVEQIRMTRKVIKDIIEIDKDFYLDFDYSNYSRYNRRYQNQSSDTYSNTYYDVDANNRCNTTNNPEDETRVDPVDDCCVK